MFKKILAMASIVCMTIFCLAGCNDKKGDSNKSSAASSSQQ